MTDISPEQNRYLNQRKRHVYIVRTARIFILFGFLILWELAADTGIIDSFIFSSPSKSQFSASSRQFFYGAVSSFPRSSILILSS